MKKRFRRISAFLAAMALTVTMTGCGDKKEEPKTDTQNNAASPAVTDGAEPASTTYLGQSEGWNFGQVMMGGGGYVTGVFSTCAEGIYYARTDVGGAYRYDSADGQWNSISYSISEEDQGLLGIDGLAVDPNNADRVFLLAGTSYFSDGKTAVLCSEDGGKTFNVSDVSDLIRVHGNGDGRGNGERIAVDPNDGKTIYAGGRTGGMIKSTDGGASWTALTAFPVTETENGNGINGIVIDGENGRIYATVSRSADDNIYVSDDGGASWTAVDGFPSGKFMPQRIKIDDEGTLYITFGGDCGPSSKISGGGIYKMTRDGQITDISPDEFRFGDIVVDPTNKMRMAACTESIWSWQPNDSYGDEFYVSTDGGANWTCINEKMTMDTPENIWVHGYAMHWCSSMMIDPFNPSRIMVVSGNGIFACDNIWDENPSFVFFCKGLEETVPQDIVSIPGGDLVTAIGDYDGFEHSDIFEYGRIHSETIGTTTSISVAALNPDVRVKVGGWQSDMKTLYTEDGGKSWTYITNKPDPEAQAYQGSIAVTADGANFIWSTAKASGAYFTSDRGASWQSIKGLRGGSYVVADKADANYVYATGANGFLVSSDGGQSFGTTMMSGEVRGRAFPEPGTAGKVYIPFEGGGLFVTEDFGKSFRHIDSVASCKAVGLGKGRTESDPLVIYIWGQPEGAEEAGIYMSEDSGESWSRINDSLHQFGGLGNGYFICGDMNVYGRCYISSVGLGLIYCDKEEK